MSARIAAVLVVLLAVMGGAGLLYYQQDRSQRPAGVEALGQPLLKGLRAADVQAIRISEPGATLRLERGSEGWEIAGRAGFSADLERVRAFVLAAIELKIGQTEPITEKDRARLALDSSGTRVDFLDAKGTALASFIAGKKYFKREPREPQGAPGDGRFVLLPQDPGRAIVVAAPLTQASAKTAGWIRRSGLAIERLRSLDYRAADGEHWRIERDADSAPWRLDGLKPHEKLDPAKANSAAYDFSALELADVAPPEAKPEDLGLDRPATVTLATFDGLGYAIRVGKLSGELYPVTVSLSGEPKPEGKDAAERARKLDERLALERSLEGRVLLVARSRLEDVLKKRADLLAKPEQKQAGKK